MVREGDTECPVCGGELIYHDCVKRIVKSAERQTKWIMVDRVRCSKCGSTHRVLPDILVPYKHYESKVIKGVLDGLITPETTGYEDYPTELTMSRWVLYFQSEKFPG